MDKVKKFRSCYICGVEIGQKDVLLEDSGKNTFIVHRDNAIAIESFKLWFEEVFMKGVPQVLTIIDYSTEANADGEAVCAVNKMVVGTAFKSALP